MKQSGLHLRFPVEPDQALGVAVSGGGDSIALLHLLADWAGSCSKALHVVTVDHGLRDASADEAAFVAGVCAALGMSHDTLNWVRDPGQGGNLQDAARRARLELIADWARGKGLRQVATGHTLDDQAETFLLRLKRGSGVDGLSAMRPLRHQDGVTWLRPILHLRRADLRQALTANELSWVDDPSNDDTAYDRVKMRNALKIMEEAGLGADRLAATADAMQRARAALEQGSLTLAHSCCEAHDIGTVTVETSALIEAPEELSLRVLAHALRWVSSSAYRPRLAALQTAFEALAAGKGTTLMGCQIVQKSDGVVEIVREFAAIKALEHASGVFDGRWTCTATDGIWRALGADGLAQRPKWRDTAESRLALMSTPSLWYNNELKSAPFIDKNPACTCALIGGPATFFESIVTH